MSDADRNAPSPSLPPDQLLALLMQWINTDSWEQSKEMLQENADAFTEALQAMVNADSPAAVIELTRKYSFLLTPEALAAIEGFIIQLRQDDQSGLADHIVQRLETLKQVVEDRRDPLNLAINALIQATPGTLRQVITQHPVLLNDETLTAFDAFATQCEKAGDTTLATRLRLRLAEVRRTHKEGEQVPQQHSAIIEEPVAVEPYEPSRSYARDHSISIGTHSGSGSVVQTNIDELHLTLPPRKWQHPGTPANPKTFVGRKEELAALSQHLIAGESVTISGTPTAVMLQGMGGIGKTYLATQLAIEVQPYFPAGVIFLKFGERILREQDAQPLLRELAGYAFEGYTLQIIEQLEPQLVKAWLEETAPGRLLVIFDDIWDSEPLRLLEQAIPANAVRIVTTRDANIAQTLDGRRKELERLTLEDGIALLEVRLGCQGETIYHEVLQKLVETLGYHAQALDIIAARIKKPQRIEEIMQELEQEVGRARLNQLKLRGHQTRVESLEKSLGLSYEHMTSEEKRCFRKLGVFEEEAPITLAAAQAIWSMENASAARNLLRDLVDLSMLEETGDSYRQHSLLQTYAYALMEDEGELNGTRWAHAEYYRVLALRAETAKPKDYPLLDRHMQNVQSALEWSKEYEPLLFSQLVEVLFQFLELRGQARKLEKYLPEAVDIAERTGHPGRQANLLRSLGDLERRLGNIDQARAHYDAALPLYRVERARLGEANLLRSLGDLESRLGNIDQARAHYDAALPLYRVERARLGEANLLWSLGDLESRLGNIDQARAHYDAALPLYRVERDRVGEANLLWSLGDLESRLGNIDQARAHYDAALPLYRVERARVGEANLLQSLGDLESRLGNIDEARAHYDAALPLYRVERARVGEANLLKSLGDLESRLGNIDEARAHYDAALPLFRQEQNRLGEANLLQSLGDLERRLGNIDEARAHYDAALPLFRQEQNRLGEANLLQSLGDLERRLGNIDEARAHYDAALPLFRQEQNRLGEANLLQSLGDLERRLGNIDEARAHYDAALPLFRQEQNRVGEANLLKSLGDLESRLGNIDEARAHYDAALPLYRVERARVGEANIYRSVAEIFVSQRDLAEARIYFERALQLYIAERTPLGQANTLLGLGVVYFESGDQEQGKQVIQEAVNLYLSMQDLELARRAELLLAQMQGQTLPEQTRSEIDIALVNTFVNTQSSQEMFQLVQQHPEMLTDTWLETTEALMEAQEDEQLKGAISERLNSLRQIRQVLEQNAVTEASKTADLVIEFTTGDWNHRRQLLNQHADTLLNDSIEPVISRLVQTNEDTEVRQVLEGVRTLLRRCRTWGVEPVFYFELHMRLGDSIDIPVAGEDTVMQVAALLCRQNDREAAWAEATVLLETLLARLTAGVPSLFEAALLRDLAETMAALPVNHPARKLDTIEACYREALSLYQGTDRSISVAKVQRAIGDILSASGRYEESLALLQAAAQGLQEYEHTRKEAAWALSAYASALDEVGRIEEAIVGYTEAMMLLPDTSALLRNRSESLIHAWQLDAAEADLARAIELDGNEDSLYLWFHRAQLALAHRDGPQADQMLDEVLKRAPAMDVTLQRAESAWLQGNLETALATLRTTFDTANPGQQAALRRELQRMFARYPDLPALPAEFLPESL